MILVPEVDDMDVMLQTGAHKVLPPMKDIPSEFKKSSNFWVGVVETWFFLGLKGCKWKPRPGVDQTKALRAITAAIGDFEPSHEHKIAGCAYLLDQWFEGVDYKPAK